MQDDNFASYHNTEKKVSLDLCFYFFLFLAGSFTNHIIFTVPLQGLIEARRVIILLNLSH